MSKLVVTQIETVDTVTPLTITTGNTGTSGSITVRSANDDIYITGNIRTSAGILTKGAVTYSANIGNNSANTFTITHSLESSLIIPAVRENSTGYYVYPDIKYVDTNSIRVEFAVAPTTNQYFVIVHA